MICQNCKNEIPDNIKFCGYCGFHLEEPVQELEKKEDDSNKTKRVKEKKPHSRIFMFLLSFSLFMGIIGGMCGAYYVAKYGWESVPYSEKLTFLPFVNHQEEKMDIYVVPIDDFIEGEDNKESDFER